MYSNYSTGVEREYYSPLTGRLNHHGVLYAKLAKKTSGTLPPGILILGHQ
jgi:hypothetical protein